MVQHSVTILLIRIKCSNKFFKFLWTDHQVGLILTVIGVVILDFCADSCDSPSKSYIIDVCNLADVDKGLNIRAVLGGMYLGFVRLDDLPVKELDKLPIIYWFNVSDYDFFVKTSKV